MTADEEARSIGRNKANGSLAHSPHKRESVPRAAEQARQLPRRGSRLKLTRGFPRARSLEFRYTRCNEIRSRASRLALLGIAKNGHCRPSLFE